MNVAQLVAPTVVTPINARKVSPSKVARAPKIKVTKEPSAKALEIIKLREELTALTGAPCSPSMSVESLTKAIALAKLPPVVEAEEWVDDYPGSEVTPVKKARTIPSKPVGITKYIVARLKEGVAAKDVLVGVYATFPTAQTSLACVYWCASKIKSGAM